MPTTVGLDDGNIQASQSQYSSIANYGQEEFINSPIIQAAASRPSTPSSINSDSDQSSASNFCIISRVSSSVEIETLCLNAFQNKMGFSKLAIFRGPHGYFSKPVLCSL